MFDFKQHRNDEFLIGVYRSKKPHLAWILKNKMYNIRSQSDLFTQREGSVSVHYLPKYILLYNEQTRGDIHLFECGESVERSQAEMQNLKYTNPSGSYITYSLKEEFVSPDLDILALLIKRRADVKGKKFDFTPFIIRGEELMQYVRTMPSKVDGNQKEIKFIDLFAGLGGIRLGFQQALAEQNLKGRCLYTAEIKPHALRAYNQNFPHEDVKYTNVTEIRKNDIEDFNVLLGGFPCQAFSSAGAGKGFADTRGTMFFEVQRIIKDHLGSVDGFILENVEGLVTHDMRENEVYEDNGHRIGRTLATILHILRDELKFNVSWAVLNAADYGIPQRRKRIYIVGCKKKFGHINLQFEKQPEVGTRAFIEHGLPCLDNKFAKVLLSKYKAENLHGKALKDKRGGARNIHSWDIEKKGAVSDIQKKLLNKLVCERRQHRWADIIGIEWMDGMPLTEQQIATFFPHPKLHQMLEDLTEKQYLVYEYPKQRVWHTDENGNRWSTRVPDESKPKGYNIVTGKLSFEISSILDPEKPVNTIVAMDMNTIGVIDGTGIRHLTLREGLRLFGYPETYTLDFFNNEKDGISNGYDLLGNSVCVPVIKMVADRLVQKLYAK